MTDLGEVLNQYPMFGGKLWEMLINKAGESHNEQAQFIDENIELVSGDNRFPPNFDTSEVCRWKGVADKDFGFSPPFDWLLDEDDFSDWSDLPNELDFDWSLL